MSLVRQALLTAAAFSAFAATTSVVVTGKRSTYGKKKSTSRRASHAELLQWKPSPYFSFNAGIASFSLATVLPSKFSTTAITQGPDVTSVINASKAAGSSLSPAPSGEKPLKN